MGQVETGAGNITGTGRLAITGASATSTIAGGLAIETSGFVYDWQTNNVGIGTAGPGRTLEVNGTVGINTDGITLEQPTQLNIYRNTADTGSQLTIEQAGGGNAALSFFLTSVKNWTMGIDNADGDKFKIAPDSLLTTGTVMTITSGGNLGIGTTTPNWLLQAAGVRPFFTLSDTGAGTDLKHRFLSSQGGNLYIGKATDAYATTTHLTIDTNGNVGIGTAAPNSKLDLGTDLTAQKLAIYDDAAGADFYGFGMQSDGLTFHTVNTQKMVLNNSGNVGIGTTSPYAKLSVAGRGVFDQDIRFDYFTATSTSATSTLAGGLAIETSGLVYDWQTNNVGIGTAGPGSKLSINGTTKGIYLDTEAINGWSGVWLGSNNLTPSTANYNLISDGVNTVINRPSGGDIAFREANGASQMTIKTSTGNVGIGTTTPSNLLDIYSSTAAIQSFSGGATKGEWSLGYDVTNNRFAIASSTSITSNVRMVIDNSGNVGIGTAAPGAKLEVNGDIYLSPIGARTIKIPTVTGGGGSSLTIAAGGAMTGGGQAGGDLILKAGNSNTGGAELAGDVKIYAGGNNYVELGALGNIIFYKGGYSDSSSEAMRIDSAGNVGIGTTTPNWKLQVAGTRPFFALSDTGASADNKHWTISSQGGNFYIATSSDAYATSTVPRITILSTGKVGIGTSSPQAELSIEGQCVDTGTGCADIAELYSSSEPTETGDIVAIDGETISAPIGLGQGSFVKKAALGEAVIGIVSSRPAMTIEGSALQFLEGASYSNNPLKPAVALAGRVPVKVSLEGGEIKAGDRIALSSVSGIGMKATSSGMTVGIALENFDGLNSTTTVFANGNEFKTGKILVFVNLGYSRLDNFAENGWNIDAQSGRIKSQYVLDMSDKEITNVRAILSASGNWSIDENGKLVVREIETGKLKVGSPAAPSGITIYDEDTGEPYCIKMKGGQMVSIVGECGDAVQSQSATQATQEVAPPVIDTESPVITINGNNPAVIEVGAAYSDLDAIVQDNISQNLGIYYKVDGVEVAEVSIDTSVAGTRTITYFAIDEAGNTGTAERQVVVEEAVVPQIITTVPSDTASTTSI